MDESHETSLPTSRSTNLGHETADRPEINALPPARREYVDAFKRLFGSTGRTFLSKDEIEDTIKYRVAAIKEAGRMMEQAGNLGGTLDPEYQKQLVTFEGALLVLNGTRTKNTDSLQNAVSIMQREAQQYAQSVYRDMVGSYPLDWLPQFFGGKDKSQAEQARDAILERSQRIGKFVHEELPNWTDPANR